MTPQGPPVFTPQTTASSPWLSDSSVSLTHQTNPLENTDPNTETSFPVVDDMMSAPMDLNWASPPPLN